MKISFVTTCMNRIRHLQQTLPANMRQNPSSPGADVEFVVLDYNSPDGLEEWIKTDPLTVDAMEKGILRYAKNHAPEKFHMSHAKNMAARLATGDIVCNVDADNYIGSDFSGFLARIFSKYSNAVVCPSRQAISRLGGGLGGRIAVGAGNFAVLGGYDETFQGWGGEDTDLKRRAKGYGLMNFLIQENRHLDVIQHSDHDRVVNMVDAAHLEEEIRRVESIRGRLTPLRKLAMIFKVLARPVQANDGGRFGMGRVTVGMDDEPLELGRLEVARIRKSFICAVNASEFVIGRLLPSWRRAETVAAASVPDTVWPAAAIAERHPD